MKYGPATRFLASAALAYMTLLAVSDMGQSSTTIDKGDIAGARGHSHRDKFPGDVAAPGVSGECRNVISNASATTTQSTQAQHTPNTSGPADILAVTSLREMSRPRSTSEGSHLLQTGTELRQANNIPNEKSKTRRGGNQHRGYHRAAPDAKDWRFLELSLIHI